MRKASNNVLINISEIRTIVDATEDLLRAGLETAHPDQLILNNGSKWMARIGRFGVILDPDECSDALRELEGNEPDMANLWMEHLAWRDLGVYPCMEYSNDHVDGIFGFAHLASLWPCSDELFQAVAEIDFNTRGQPISSLPNDLRTEININASKWRKHLKAQGIKP